ncbi:MAG: ribosome biogenesis GTP-binding protein YihA/YsxC [Bacteroidota bacterium]
MEITQAEFIKSSQNISQLPPSDRPEYAFTGRSNVGKSSLINYLCNRRNLALTSGTPGKTQLINHFLINKEWYLVDLPGYGYAKVSKVQRGKFQAMMEDYLLNRPNLMNTFVLVDSKIPPQDIDLQFMEFLGVNGLPFSIVFTKTDKPKPDVLEKYQALYKEKLFETWEELPPMFYTTATKKKGKEQILDYIELWNDHF